MTATEKYNGWQNYETWCVRLWMGNDEGLNRHYAILAQECFDAASAGDTFTREEQATFDLAEALRDQYETDMDEWLTESKRAGTVWADLVSAALSEVNWHEIAASLIEEVDKTDYDAEEDE